MAELNVPNYMTNRPESIADLVDSSMRMAGNAQTFGANQQKMANANQFKQAFQGGQPNMQDLYRIDPERAQAYQNSQLTGQTNQMQQASTAHKLGSQVATEIVGKVQAMGLDPSAPDFQQKLDQISAPYRPIMASATGKPDTGEPMHYDSLLALKGLTKTEYHPPVPTSQGYLEFKNNGFAPMVNPEGKPYMPGAVDVGNKFDVGMAGTLSKLVEQGHIPLEQAQSILKSQVMSQNQPQAQIMQQQPQNQAPQVSYDFAPTAQGQADKSLAETYQNNLAEQNKRMGGIPSSAEREGIKAQADINKAVELEAGKSQFEANRDLPAAMDQASNALDLIKKLKEHEGKAGFVGMPNASGLMGGVRGTKEADFKVRLEQIKGQTFLQAFNSLKGAGQITEVEGQKATQAIARLDASQSEKEFDTALDDLSSVIDQGLIRAKTKAKGSSNNPKIESNNIKSDADAILRGR